MFLCLLLWPLGVSLDISVPSNVPMYRCTYTYDCIYYYINIYISSSCLCQSTKMSNTWFVGTRFGRYSRNDVHKYVSWFRCPWGLYIATIYTPATVGFEIDLVALHAEWSRISFPFGKLAKWAKTQKQGLEWQLTSMQVWPKLCGLHLGYGSKLYTKNWMHNLLLAENS